MLHAPPTFRFKFKFMFKFMCKFMYKFMYKFMFKCGKMDRKFTHTGGPSYAAAFPSR